MNNGLLRGLPQKPYQVALIYVIDGGTLAITTGVKGNLSVPFDMVLTGWSILADASGSIVIDVWSDIEANYPPTVAATITGTAKPTISSAAFASSESLTGWRTAIAKGEVLRFNVDSISTIKRVTLTLLANRVN